MALVCIGTVLYGWLGHANAMAHAALGRPVSLAVLGIALVATVIGALASFVARDALSGLRWGVALPVAVLAVGVIVLAAGSLVAPQHVTDFFSGVLLLLAGGLSMLVVTVQVERRRLPGSDAMGSR